MLQRVDSFAGFDVARQVELVRRLNEQHLRLDRTQSRVELAVEAGVSRQPRVTASADSRVARVLNVEIVVASCCAIACRPRAYRRLVPYSLVW